MNMSITYFKISLV